MATVNKKIVLKIKTKKMSKKGWKRVKQKKYFFLNIQEGIEKLVKDNSNGIASVIEFLEINEPLKVNYFNKDTVLLDKDYYWMQIAFEQENFWITAIFNKEKELIQVYFDVSKENVLKENGESFFYDLFIDVILMDSTVVVLDEDELEEAKVNKVITKQEYNLAVDTKTRILDFLSQENNKEILKEYLYKTFNLLIEKREEKNII